MDQHHQTYQACCSMFGEWLEGKGRKPITWETVINVLEEVEKFEVARDLKDVLGITHSEDRGRTISTSTIDIKGQHVSRTFCEICLVFD